MAIRDILDYQGVKIGELELPDGTSEEVWAAKLAPYAVAPLTQEQQIISQLKRTVQESKVIADEVMEEFKKENLLYFATAGISNDLAVLKSLWVHHRLRAVDITVGGLPVTVDIMNMVVSGDIETAYVALSYMTPDDMSQDYHFLSTEKINDLKTKLGARLGLA